MPALLDGFAVAMAESKKRSDKTVKIDRNLATKASVIVEARGLDGHETSVAEYISELIRPLIERDYAKAIKTLETHKR